MEAYTDINKQLSDVAERRIKGMFPIETASKIITLDSDLELVFDKDIYSDIPGQKDAKIKRKSWTLPIKGTLSVYDKQTKTKETKKIKLVDIPMMTNRYSFIIDGNEYSSMYQWRLKPGVYTRLTNDGFYESTFNLALAKLNMRLDPESLLFYLTVEGTTEKFYVYTILNGFNVPDSQIKEAWGKEIFEKNKAVGLSNEGQTLIGFAKKIVKIEPEKANKLTIEEAKELILKYFAGTHLDAQVVNITVGVESNKIDAPVLLATSKKLLKVMRGEAEEDERDSLAFKDLYNVADRVDYYLERNLKPVIKKIEYKLRGRSNPGDILTPDTINKSFKNAFLSDDLISPIAQTNPMEMLLESRKTTVTGPGGIQSRHAITEDVRNIHPSHIGILDPLQTPEGQKIGVTLPLSVYSKKVGKTVKTKYITKDGIEIFLSPIETYDKTIGFPGEFDVVNGKPVAKKNVVKGYKAGKPGLYNSEEIDIYILSPHQLWSLGTAAVPFLNSNSGNRIAMAGRQMTQAVPLRTPQAPLVSVKNPTTGGTWFQTFGKALNTRVPMSFVKGTVMKVDKDYITLKENTSGKTHKVGLYNNFPLNQESFLNSTVEVKVGDVVDKNTVLARNNFQAPDHSLALGRNVNVAYMPFKGLNVEDATVLTETAANDYFVSEHIERETLLYDKKTILNLNRFRVLFPEKIEAKLLGNYDEEGIVKQGTILKNDEYVIMAAREKELTPEQIALSKLNKKLATPYVDLSIKWEFDEPGEVVYVNKGSKKIDVHIKVASPARVGDKFAGLFGNKIVVSKIIPDHEAPHTADGRRADIVMHPYGVIGRANVGQLLSTAAGKIAQKTGKPYIITNFENEDNVDRVLKDLKEAGVTTDEVMLDGKDGKPFEQKIFYGPQYIMKLKHMVDHKMKTRSYGSYDVNEQVTAGKHGGQNVDHLQWYALIANGLKKNVAETTKYLTTKNDEFWRAIQLNLPIPEPKRNFVWDKFESYLKGSGITLKRDGNLVKMLPLTDKGVLEISNGVINDPKELIGKNLGEIKGGLFDPEVTGGLNGDKYSHMELIEKIPNPVFEDTLQKLMGITKREFANKLNNGTLSSDVKKFLSEMNVDEEIAKIKNDLYKAKKADMPKHNFKLRVLENLKEMDITPEEAYMTSYLPLIPPKFRPIYPLPNGDLNSSPINKHYKDVGLINKQLKEITEMGIQTKDVKAARARLYLAVKAAQGLGDPITYDNTKEGLLQTLAGPDPKSGFVQGKLWKKRRDLSGRSVATVDPTLGLDELGIPNVMLWDIYKPFIIKELIKMGMTPALAARNYKERSPVADKALDLAIEGRPVFMNRAPSLHKHSVMSFMPRRTNEISIQANPMIFSGFNLDFDGDTVSIYPPVTTEAVEESYNILPSRVPFKHGTRKVLHGHTWDYKVGLYYATKKERKTGLKFKDIESARNYKPELSYNDVFDLNGTEMTLGLWDANEPLPKEMKDYNRPIDAKVYSTLLEEIVQKYPNIFTDVINKWKDLGYTIGYRRGTSLSINDMVTDKTVRNKLMGQAMKDIKKNPENMVDIMNKAEGTIVDDQKKQLQSNGNRTWEWIESKALAGAKGKNLDAILSMVGVVADLKGNPVPVPITKSWAEGQDVFDYWNTLYGARKGSVDRSINTQDSGYLNKVLLSNTSRIMVTEEDCETPEFIEEEQIHPMHLIGRVIAKNIPGVGHRGDVIDMARFNIIKKKGMKTVPVRSPLTCEAKDDGVCQQCYGLSNMNRFPALGESVGVADSQALTEPLSQDVMRTFHSGGKVGVKNTADGFDRADEILRMKKNLQGIGTLSLLDGKVDGITPNPAGGFNVKVSNKSHYIPIGREITVKMGQSVGAGDPLSDGVYRPQDIAELKGIMPARNYMTSQLQNTLGDKDGLIKRTVETIVKGITDRVIITNDRGEPGILNGDITFENRIKRINRDRVEKELEPIEFKPYLRNIDILPLYTEDWGEMLGSRALKKVITSSASLGRNMNIHGTHPLPGYMYAVEYGQEPYY